ncbi:MAG: HAMP domain-containing protein [Spirochaetales bacterium]|nr:HAMP domain-containing protein [Spirochaetales bacterium]
MKIRTKIIFIVLPLIAASLMSTGIISYFSASSGLTRITRSFFGFKANELIKQMNSQWDTLVELGQQDQEEFRDSVKNSIYSYAVSIILNRKTELIFALDNTVLVTMKTSDFEIRPNEREALQKIIEENRTGYIEFELAGIARVGFIRYFEPLGWHTFVTEQKSVFYKDIDKITLQTIIVLAAALLVSILLLGVFMVLLTRPLSRVVTVMRQIISTNDMDQRVEVEFKDEIGQLAHTFNIMVSELQKAYSQIKEFAFQSVLAKKNEQKIRNIFQKYVPKDVIDGIFSNPDSALIGDNRVVAILFSDIRSFTTISEGYMPDELVSTLNRYFEAMVDIIMNHGGVIDKYIGDAIMAIFGAPVKHPDDAFQAALAALEMQRAIGKFNDGQLKAGKPQFVTGIGINYGVVTVGNIGSEKKMDYTVIGDMVNLASRLEGLTKKYKQNIIVSESMYRKLKDKLPCRWVDKVVVKGKTMGENIYTARNKISAREQKGWTYHHAGQKFYYGQHFRKAIEYFEAVLKLLPGDHLANMYIERARKYLKNPPGKDWNGLEVLTEK